MPVAQKGVQYSSQMADGARNEPEQKSGEGGEAIRNKLKDLRRYTTHYRGKR